MKYCFFSSHQFKKYLKTAKISRSYYHLPIGMVEIVKANDAVYKASLMPDHASYDKDLIINNDQITSLALVGTDFQIKVWQSAVKIPAGKTASYQEIAHAVGHPKAVRAVANALANNPIIYFIPCHRVIGKSGKLTGYRWGLEKKSALLEAEKQI